MKSQTILRSSLLASFFLGIALPGLSTTITLGDPVVNRIYDDTNGTAGTITIYKGQFSVFGDVTQWRFFNADDNSSFSGSSSLGRSITPLLFENLGGNQWQLTGIGATRTNAGTGLQEFFFDLVSGTAAVTPNHTFGWRNGPATGTGNAGVVEWVNSGATSVTGYAWTGGVAQNAVVGNNYLQAADFSGTGFATFPGGRIYSVQFDATVPEPSSFLMLLSSGIFLFRFAKRK